MTWPPLVQKHPDGNFLARGYRRGEEPPSVDCPYCQVPIQGHWQFNGVGMQKMDPLRCSLCGAQEGVTEDHLIKWTTREKE
jgi:hypothetical protein